MKHLGMKQFFRSLPDIINYVRNPEVLIISVLIMLFPISLPGQKQCSNPPVVSLSESGGTTCYLAPITVSGNTFGGGATAVTITENGHGSIVPSSVTSSPFSFTYTPVIIDAGRVVTITVTTNNPDGKPCKASSATYSLNVISSSPVPNIENIIQPTCTSSTGSVELGGLPSYGSWTLTVSPGGMTIEGSGTAGTIPNLPSGTYTFTVSVSTQCTSLPSVPAVIGEQPITPAPPLPGTITAPTCAAPTGSVILTGLPSAGTWILTRYPGTAITSGTGISTTISGLSPGIYNFSLTNAAGCISLLSADVTMPTQPPAPAAPVIGTVIQPTPETMTGSVTLTSLPSTGTWTIIRSPGEVTLTSSGNAVTITGLEVGTYTFKVRNSSGCISPESAPLIISSPVIPELVITDPQPVCYPATVDLTAPEIKEGSTIGLTYTYWTDAQAATALETPASASNGTYYIKGTSASGFFDIKPVKVTVRQPAVSNAGPDQILSFQYNTLLEAELGEQESGTWFSDSANVVFNDVTDPRSAVSNLSQGENVVSWVVSDGICPADTDKVIITVGELVIPTLITPNGDSWNEYFVIKGLENLGKTQLTVFDRRGTQIFQDSQYDNKWNGVDNNEKPLANDTYFFVLKSVTGKSYNGYIVIRK
jgi:gliding motility-associated-like protein